MPAFIMKEYTLEDLLKVGIITTTHGIRGEVKVFPTTDDMKRFKKLKHCVLQHKKEMIDLEVESCKFFKNLVILKFKGIDNINDVMMYKDCELFVTREHAVKLKKDEYFICDMIGAKVVTEEGEDFGVLDEVLLTGANDVYVVKREGKKEVLLPAIKECILNVDLEEKVITIHVMKGLLEE
ncbi:MAG: 16S rRNA processing protein RimM [Lachnospiraceae bacterium]|nr:16S rRNA processing protein RimM [Lachnospiraceae bacterium]